MPKYASKTTINNKYNVNIRSYPQFAARNMVHFWYEHTYQSQLGCMTFCLALLFEIIKIGWDHRPIHQPQQSSDLNSLHPADFYV